MDLSQCLEKIRADPSRSWNFSSAQLMSLLGELASEPGRVIWEETKGEELRTQVQEREDLQNFMSLWVLLHRLDGNKTEVAGIKSLEDFRIRYPEPSDSWAEYEGRGLTPSGFSQLFRETLATLVSRVQETPFWGKIQKLGMEWMEKNLKPSEFPKKIATIYRSSRVGKNYFSIDLVKGNATLWMYFIPQLVGIPLKEAWGVEEVEGVHPYESWIHGQTDLEIFQRSKYFRQVFFGQLQSQTNETGLALKKIQMWGLPFLTNWIRDQLVSPKSLPGPLISYQADELVFEVTEWSREHWVKQMRENGIPEWLIQNLHLDYFRMEEGKLPSGEKFYLKRDLTGEGEDQIKGISHALHGQVRAQLVAERKAEVLREEEVEPPSEGVILV